MNIETLRKAEQSAKQLPKPGFRDPQQEIKAIKFAHLGLGQIQGFFEELFQYNDSNSPLPALYAGVKDAPQHVIIAEPERVEVRWGDQVQVTVQEDGTPSIVERIRIAFTGSAPIANYRRIIAIYQETNEGNKEIRMYSSGNSGNPRLIPVKAQVLVNDTILQENIACTIDTALRHVDVYKRM